MSETFEDEQVHRAVARVGTLMAKRARKLDRIAQQRRAALAETVEPWLEGLDETERTRIFAELEGVASARARRILEEHPLRPKVPATFEALSNNRLS